MKRLLKISFDQALLSLTPILSWFCLSLLVDKSLINVFTITYPIQYIYYIIWSVFGVGANISKIRDRNKHAVMSGLVLGVFATILIFGGILTHVDSYIEFMNMDVEVYHTFVFYSVINLGMQTIFSLVLDKLYFEEENTRANRYSIILNALSFGSLIGTALLTKSQSTIATVAVIIPAIFIIFTIVRVWDKFKFRINLLHCIKYDSVALSGYGIAFFIYLFGLSNALEFGPEYSLAITFVSLITDTQWDVLDAVNAVAKIDITKRHFNFRQSLRNAYKLVILLYCSVGIMFFCLHRFYNLNLPIVLTFLGLELIAFAIDPIYYLYTCYLQLNWSPSKATANKISGRFVRFAVSLAPTPYCTSLGGISSSLYQLITFRHIFYKHFYIDKNGKVVKRRTRTTRNHTQHRLLSRFRYDDLSVDEEE